MFMSFQHDWCGAVVGYPYLAAHGGGDAWVRPDVLGVRLCIDGAIDTRELKACEISGFIDARVRDRNSVP